MRTNREYRTDGEPILGATEASVQKSLGEGGEISVLKDAVGLGVLLLLITSMQMASFVFGA